MTRCNDKVTEQLVSDTFYKVDKAVYRHLRDVYSYPEASPDVKAASGKRPTLWDPDLVRGKQTAAKIRIEPQRVLDFDGNNSVFDDMNYVNQRNASVLVDEDDTYDEFLEEEVLDYPWKEQVETQVARKWRTPSTTT